MIGWRSIFDLTEWPGLRQIKLDPIRNILRKSYFTLFANSRGVLRDLDSGFYLKFYSDVANSKMSAIEHFLRYGRHEGRMPKAPIIVLQGSMETEFDPSRENVLVVSHEASRTGAPILSLNLVRVLKPRYNVVALVLSDGSLINSFRDEGAVVLGPCGMRNNPFIANLILEQLFSRCIFKFALVNSIESRVVLPILAKHFIPSISLLHEFASYTRPYDAFGLALFWSSEVVFSSKLTHQNALDQHPHLGQRFAHILPQGRCILPKEKSGEEAQFIRRGQLFNLLHAAVKNHEEPFLVLGAGVVQMRKGVDLFIQCAARVVRSHLGRSIRFVWVGKGFDPENDVNYSAYLADQIDRAGLAEHIVFIEETSEMDTVYQFADLLLLTSRLDPMPNVAIDALSEGIPVICFEKTTGIADILIEAGLREECVAEYLDTEALADKILRFAKDDPYYRDIVARCKQLAVLTFDMERYVHDLEKLVKVASKQVEQEARDVAEIFKSKLLNQDFCCPPQDRSQPLWESARGYVRAWASGIGRRKPCPGFSPGIYLQQHGVSTEGSEPFADYLRSGAPAGAWKMPVIQDSDNCLPFLGEGRIALHLHVFYPDLLAEMLDRLQQNTIRPDLFISIPASVSSHDVARQLATYSGKVIAIETVPNRGRDIGPFLTAFGPRIAASYDFIGHLHTKKSVDTKDSSVGVAWFQFLLENMLGGSCGAMMDRILGFMSNASSIGMVFPDDPNVIGWSANKPFAAAIAKQLDIKELPEHFAFPIGTMFWARVGALKHFWELELDWDDYPEEPLPNDGSVLHAIERLLPLGLVEGTNQCALTYVTGISR